MRLDGEFDASALRAARTRVALTQHELAVAVGVGGGERVSLWELGVAVPRPELVARLCDVLDVAPEVLVPGGGRSLRVLRLRAGLSAGRLARAAHVSLPAYKR
ncbi:MAG: helix-turn-helix transcriptional regulator, partial [Candidatus Phosphoribacter sp.]